MVDQTPTSMTDQDALLLARVRRQREIAEELRVTEREKHPDMPVDEFIDMIDRQAFEQAAAEEERALGTE